MARRQAPPQMMRHESPTPETPRTPLTPRQQKTTAWNDVLDICKKGFTQKMNTVGEEILTDMRSEFHDAVSNLRNDMSDQFDLREKENNNMENFVKILDEIRAKDKVRADDAKKNALATEEQLVQIMDNVQRMQTQSVFDRERAQAMSDKLQLAENHLQQLSKCQNDLFACSTGISQEIQRIHKQVTQSHNQVEGLESTIDNQLVQYFRGPTSVTVDVQSVREQVKRIEEVVNIDFTLILHEIVKVQRGLHLEFPQTAPLPKSPVSMKRLATPSKSGLVLEDEQAAPDPGGLPGERMTIPDGSAYEMQVGLVVVNRLREIYTQTDEKLTTNSSSQTEKIQNKSFSERPRRQATREPEKPTPPATKKPMFADAEALKAKARLAKVKAQYSVVNEYYTEGHIQKIARSPIFENVTLGVVIVNAIWMAVDTDLNDEALIINADPVFIFAENVFCTYFFLELSIRFGAFKKKCRCFRDGWFVFDLFLVFMMALETWLVPIVVTAFNLEEAFGSLDLAFLRMVRMVKILRLSRMAKLLRAIPELSIIVKGIGFAARSVAVFFLLWLMIIFVFSIILKQVTVGQDVGREFFHSVPEAMDTLLMNGIVPDQAPLLKAAMSSNPGVWMIVMAFVLLASVTIMYMLVGVLVQVMTLISSTEKEGATVSFVASQLRESMQHLNYNLDAHMTQEEFQKLMMEPDICQIMGGVGVDIVVLMDMIDIIYEDLEKKGLKGLSFESMVDLVLNLRGTNMATVKDVKELMRVLKAVLKDNILEINKKMSDEFHNIRMDIFSMRHDQDRREDDMVGNFAFEGESGTGGDYEEVEDIQEDSFFT
eukprot:TRINITY_DN3625_c0_g1_i1.p1 TRINITY_DN3625_c0_g1~~TRINITY_DN3625_c0_g1_i1.p1  ORF type:complete len:842 (-),score=179.38 TRINITY_DN3625_c0_g1_i1:30-2507(-)